MRVFLAISLTSFSQMLCQENATETRGECKYRRNRPGFECDDGQCIDRGLVCDKRPDCEDGSDEAVDCCASYCITASGSEVCLADTGYNMTAVEEEDCRDCTIGGYPGFRCDNGQCIYRRKVCDGRAQCEDKSDEDDCDFHDCLAEDGSQVKVHKDLLEVKTPREFGDKCRRCDYNSHGDGFRCDSGQCILSAWSCDGTEECEDGSDEKQALCYPELEVEEDNPEQEVNEETTTIKTTSEDQTCPRDWECKKFSQCETFENFLEGGGIFRELRCNPLHLSWVCCDPEGAYVEYLDDA